MCGIFVVIPKKKNKINIKKCLKSLDELKRRGPDYNFFNIKDNIFFGQTVLSMAGDKNKRIDHYTSHDHRYLIAYNGEIYNYIELSKKISSKLRSKYSDTNVLVNLFTHTNLKNITKLVDGMYAFVVYDSIKKKIIISRDPQGEKSLFLYEDNKFIILSSEIKPINLFVKKLYLNKDILKSYFYTRHFISFEKTIYKNLSIINPGDTLTLDIDNMKFKKSHSLSIFDLVDKKMYMKNQKKKEIFLINELESILKRNIKQMIPFDRNSSSIISGGVDSSIISYIINKINKKIKFITLDHLGKDKISNKIKLFENKIKSKILKKNVSLKDYKNSYKKCLEVCSSPINSHDFPGRMIIARQAKSLNSKCIFGGDGADELFGGYETYRQKISNKKINKSNYTKLLYTGFFKKNLELKYFKKKMDFYWKKSLNAYNFIKNTDERNRQAMMLIDTAVQLSSVGLRGTDLMSMYNSVEPRSPFLRKELIKFALNLPIRFKISLNGDKIKNKILLSKLFVKYFGNDLLFPKQGFSGFPNEINENLKKSKKFIINKYLKNKIDFKYYTRQNPQLRWKISNMESFLKKNNF
ncbi:MAG: hypothetical protein CBD76_02635 [Pelagibacteraceae bacterium TMED216]|nr:MAG: hypothetical protein CBD76_02635 [Pelagibacteraceae bacterium TMED216]